MKQLYTFTISGMTCHACEKLITLDLEEAGLTLTSIDHQTGQLVIELDPSAVDRVKEIIQSGHTYTVSAVEPN